MIQKNYIDLPDGRQLDYEIRTTAKARSLRLKMTARDGLTVIAPQSLNERRITELVTEKRDWILAKLNQFDEVRHLLGEPNTAARPQAFDLPALAESWRVEYQVTKSKTVGARTDHPGRVVVYGAVSDNERCKSALRRWLARRAKEALVPWLKSLSADSGLKFNNISVKNQRTRWGSCSADGVRAGNISAG
jgi:predicted metal-dependent hydrolase